VSPSVDVLLLIWLRVVTARLIAVIGGTISSGKSVRSLCHVCVLGGRA